MSLTKSWQVTVLCDIFSIVLVYIPWIVLVWGGIEPFRRGFYCNDQTISYPYNSSTVPGVVMEALGFILPAIAIIVCESVHSYKLQRANRLDRVYHFKSFSIHPFFIAFYKLAVIYTFGAALQQTLSNICKYSTGRLRPHFFYVCNITLTPEMCLDSNDRYRYVTDYTCNGDEKDARLSFFSGHTSNSSYTAAFIILYLHYRFTWRKRTCVARTLIQFALAIGAALMGLSRICDYKHHWSDVIAGSFVGIGCAFFMVYAVSDLVTQSLPSIYTKPTHTNSQPQLTSYDRSDQSQPSTSYIDQPRGASYNVKQSDNRQSQPGMQPTLQSQQATHPNDQASFTELQPTKQSQPSYYSTVNESQPVVGNARVQSSMENIVRQRNGVDSAPDITASNASVNRSSSTSRLETDL